jgi:hypothetical protein
MSVFSSATKLKGGFYVQMPADVKLSDDIKLIPNGTPGHYLLAPMRDMTIKEYRDLLDGIQSQWTPLIGNGYDARDRFDRSEFGGVLDVEIAMAEAMFYKLSFLLQTRKESAEIDAAEELYLDIAAGRCGDVPKMSDTLRDILVPVVDSFDLVLEDEEQSLRERRQILQDTSLMLKPRHQARR